MKKVNEIFGEKTKKKTFLATNTKKQLMTWALKAHKLDNTRSVEEYYSLFLKRLRKVYVESNQKEAFFENHIIEV